MAAEAFRRGYNCAQAVAVAYCDLLGMTEAQAARMGATWLGGCCGTGPEYIRRLRQHRE